MNMYDALKILGISESSVTEDVVKSAYRQACLKYHPDRNPAGLEMMMLVNAAKEALKDVTYPIEYKAEEGYDYGQEINEALNKIITLQGLTIEVCGAWVWVSGETKEHWTLLKDAGFKFSPPKKMVYFRPHYAKTRRFRKDGLAIEEIRAKYGADKIKSQKPFYLQARS